jgi:PEP-CTERM motif
MCTVLSLAIRAFLALLGGAILAFASLPTRAEELQFDLTGTAFTQDNGFYPGVGPFDISFMLDTSRSTSLFVFGNGCLQRFGGTAALSNVTVTVNGQSMMSASSLTGGYGGDNPAGQCPGGFLAALVAPNLVWEFDSRPGIDQTILQASADPLATLFLNFQQYPGGAESGGLNMDIKSVTVTPVSVPEPGTLGLLMLGFAGVVLCGRKRTSYGLHVRARA